MLEGEGMTDSKNRAQTGQQAQFRLGYFDTSSWDALAKDPNREQFIHLIQREGLRVMASVISVGEVLRTPNLDQRELTCATM
jgi:hypothetical protein